MSEFVWEPTAEYVEAAKVSRLMRAHGIVDYFDLVRRSQDDIEWFWEAAIEDLGLEFFKPYAHVLDDSRGPEWPRWFTGGSINLAHNCVDRHAASELSDEQAIVWEGEDGSVRTMTFADLDAESSRVASGLQALGLGEGDAVGVYMPMVPEAVAAAYGCAKIGAVYLPIFSGFGAPAVAARLNDSRARVLITADGALRRGARMAMKSTADEAVAESPSVEHVVVYERFGRGWPRTKRDLSWQEAFGGASIRHPARELDPEAPFMIAYTSGTTGQPKGSVHVHGGFLVKISEEARYQVDMGPGQVLYFVTDMGWIMGPWEMVGAHSAGACVLMYEGAPNYPGPDRVWAMCERHGVTVLGVSPTLIRALMPSGEEPVRSHDLSQLRMMASTGEPWNPEPYRWLSEVVGGSIRPIINLSGGTEVGACFLGGSPLVPTKSCSLGPPSLGMAVEVYGTDGRPVRGEVGELVCTKPWPAQTRGFWRNEQRYIDTYWSRWPGVWVHGDWASIDSDGYWFLHGRSDDTLNIAGKRIGPAEFESAAVDHPAVTECAAVGVPDEIKGEAVWLFCILAPHIQPTEELRLDVKRTVSEQLGRAFAPSQVRFVEELPKTRSAKILRRLIRAKVMGDDLGDTSSLENPSAVQAVEKSLP
jgi:acetyl-CoA synthetase